MFVKKHPDSPKLAMLIRLTGSGEAAFSCAIAADLLPEGVDIEIDIALWEICFAVTNLCAPNVVASGQEKQVTLQLVVPISITIAALLSGINRAPRHSENAIQYRGDNRHQTNGDDIAVEDFQQPEAERVTAIKETGNRPLEPSANLKLTSFAMPVINGAILVAIHRSAIITGIAARTVRKILPRLAKAIIDAITAGLARSPSGRTSLHGRTNAIKTEIGVSSRAVEIIAGLPTATAISGPI